MSYRTRCSRRREKTRKRYATFADLDAAIKRAFPPELCRVYAFNLVIPWWVKLAYERRWCSRDRYLQLVDQYAYPRPDPLHEWFRRLQQPKSTPAEVK
jgi:hypothetical protein